MVSFDQINDIKQRLCFENCLSYPSNKIWLLWRHGLSLHPIVSTDQLIHVEVSGSHGQFLSYFTAIYAKCTRAKRGNLWDSIMHIQAQIKSTSRPWIIGGDFNAIAKLDEHAGRSIPDLTSIREFSTLISDAALLELPTSGGPFTWTGVRHSGRVWRRLDRLLVNQ